MRLVEWGIALFVLNWSAMAQDEVASPIIDDMDENRSGPTVRIQIPTGLRKAGRQYNKLEMAKRIAAARQANKQAVQAEGRQLSWESLALPKIEELPEEDEDSVSYQNQEQLEDSLPDIKRYIHIDLSALPPSNQYLHELLALLAENGVGGVFLEYGNRFPYEKDLKVLKNNDVSYSKEEIIGIISYATKLQIEILPGIYTIFVSHETLLYYKQPLFRFFLFSLFFTITSIRAIVRAFF